VTHWRALDGVRGVAVLLVVAYHLEVPYSVRGGSIGVTTFFVLSGFLITTLLLREADATGGVRRFYARRALRLLPALAVFVPVVVIYAWVTARPDDTVNASSAVVFYGANWVRAIRGFNTLGLFEHTWSLSVEEQFYLVWPAVVLLAGVVAPAPRRAGFVLGFSVAGIVASFLWRFTVWNPADPSGAAARLYNGTDAAADQLLIGCALAAVLMIGSDPLKRRIGAWCRWLAPVAMAFLLWIAMFRPGGTTPSNTHLYLTWGQTAFSAAAAVIIGAAVLAPAALISRLLALRPLVAVGRVSYGLYLWHYPVIVVIDERLTGVSDPVRWITALVVVFTITTLSWVAVERPCLELKRRFESGAHAGPQSRLATAEVR
jgi:peptidoglycan/LPS O-acetylase OafA/YrhL